jgi:hypothetical protein
VYDVGQLHCVSSAHDATVSLTVLRCALLLDVGSVVDHSPAVRAAAAGPLLGAGSFARVFKAKWAGLDVAVKVGMAVLACLLVRWQCEHQTFG